MGGWPGRFQASASGPEDLNVLFLNAKLGVQKQFFLDSALTPSIAENLLGTIDRGGRLSVAMSEGVTLRDCGVMETMDFLMPCAAASCFRSQGECWLHA
jgi:hypothetical protein